ncbi:MAG: hypothetical protein C0459_07230 [Chitinophaga sp.]|jgi:hypothetical protein|nr:hypothetical protein [Chitinophaga sp.]
MFQRIKNILLGETFSYDINLSLNKVLDKFDDLFINKSGLSQRPNLTGDFVDYPNGFYLTNKYSDSPIRGNRRIINLYGKIESISNDKTKIIVTIQPNTGALLILAFSILLSIILIIIRLFQSNKIMYSQLIGFPIISVVLIVAIISSFNKLKNSFEEFILSE